jgi:hypothetical protein
MRVNAPEHAVDLVNFRVARKEWFLREEFGENDSNRPNVHWWRVNLLAQQNLRSAVPERHDFMGVFLHRDTKRPCESKVSNLELAVQTNEQVLRLQIAGGCKK